ncbi:PC-Esterase [Sesbania bispinosa]|nr:PC-Esterase [Sesbania bispinosa]
MCISLESWRYTGKNNITKEILRQIRPNIGIIKPKETCDFTGTFPLSPYSVLITNQPQRTAPPAMQCKDKFLIQSTVVPFGATEDDITSDMGQSAISVDYTLKILTCREQQKKLSALEMELATAKQEGFVLKHLSGNDQKHPTKNTVGTGASQVMVVSLESQTTEDIMCVFCSQPNVTDYNVDFPFRVAFRTSFRYINSCKECRRSSVTVLRTFAPAHFENGVWNTGGYCNRTGPVSEGEVDFGSFDWEMRNIQMEEFERGRDEERKKGKRFEVVDVTRAMMMRPDGHPGEYWGNKWMRGYNDCTHWCLPGPVDMWTKLLLVVLIREAEIMSPELEAQN